MADDTRNRAENENWTRDKWKGEGQGGEPVEPAREKDSDDSHWQKHQWEGQGQSESPHDPRSTPQMEEGEHEFSGHGKNPAREHWGEYDFDDEDEEDNE